MKECEPIKQIKENSPYYNEKAYIHTKLGVWYGILHTTLEFGLY